MSALKKLLFPSREEQEAKWKRQEEQRRKNYEFQSKRLGYIRASAGRQKALAQQEAGIRRLRGETQALQPKPQARSGIDFEAFFGKPTGKPVQDPAKAIAEQNKKLKKMLV
jgi:hypothetical protein